MRGVRDRSDRQAPPQEFTDDVSAGVAQSSGDDVEIVGAHDVLLSCSLCSESFEHCCQKKWPYHLPNRRAIIALACMPFPSARSASLSNEPSICSMARSR